MCGRASSNSRQSAVSGRRCRSANRCEHQQDGAVGKIGTGYNVVVTQKCYRDRKNKLSFRCGKNGAHETMALARLVAGAPGKTVSYEFVLSHLWQELERYDNLEARLRSLEFQTSVAMAAASRFQRAIR
jgi:hypothetical protein